MGCPPESLLIAHQGSKQIGIFALVNILLKRLVSQKVPSSPWHFQDSIGEFRYRVAEGVSTQVEALAACDADSMWNTLSSIIKDAAKDTLGVAVETPKTHMARRESWWLCEEVQATQAKEKAYEYLYKKLDSKEGANNIFKITKARERRRRDLGDICFIKDKEGRTITDEAKIKKRWKEYFLSLFNMREPKGHKDGVGPNREPHTECYYLKISQAEVRTTFLKMGRNKAVGPDQIPIKSWKSQGDEGAFWLTSLFSKIFTSAKMPEECTEFFPVDVRFHQGSTISPYLFALILDGLSRGIQEDIPWCLIFADDIVLVSELAKDLNTRLENCRNVLEDNGLRVSQEKT
uniref:Retrovirus-related Pol polyprotein LINE-1 n=1 Tax=Tanacetum cinerariifolium TaxID=118510 RepID=A0A699IRU0_TANCI|nr:retrovirus-related Pol polyprotein LINE-1 [Tanacetum cinerariifolium]